jgi:outer membrane protein OmpA-like peptidoglycan-associated protein
LIIEGHTDSDGDSDYNDRLSQLRAEAVRELMISQFEFIDPSVLVAKGYGEDRPLVANDSAKNKALNRRIEFVVWWEGVEARADVTVDQQ